MAEFNQAFSLTSGHEGGYVNDLDDAGGETYRGVSRRYHPSWPGWSLIDEIKSDNPDDLDDALSEVSKIQQAVEDFYKQLYWDRFWGDNIPTQDIGNELFDTSVNLGVHRAVKYLQEGLNLLNRNQKSYNDIVEDGLFGRGTLRALNAFLEQDKSAVLLKVMNTLQGMHYISYMRKNPAQEKYARGWLKRA